MTYTSLTPNLMVDDVNATVDFYRDILGFNLIVSVPESGRFNWAMMGSGGALLMFQTRESLGEELPMLAERPIQGGLTLYTKLKGLDELHERVKSTGIVVKEPYTAFYGPREFVIQDPNGYLICFSEEDEQ